ncbi:holo-ACP synthase [Alicyclobacillus herbarius]|uniref:holo-ACP synthase n=1 Tax=Alicyclobacillus herbarius TaxID=122960 RepID=UPI000478E02C|nr:holo-ACP synthase [Alicyclobacillus herbarius]
MILGIGVDAVELERMDAALRRHGQRLIQRVLHPLERDLIGGMSDGRLVEFVAGRFAAKEAIAKATGAGLGRLGINRVAVLPGDAGLTVEWAAELVGNPFVAGRWWVTLSHTRTLALAMAVREAEHG